jgi:nitrous oxidase accessory protein NosD
LRPNSKHGLDLPDRILLAVNFRQTSPAFFAACVAAAAIVSVSAAGPAAGGAPTGALYVSPHGVAGAAGADCSSAAYSSVQAALDRAPSRGTVVVCRGSYKGNVVISKPLRLTGKPGAVIHASATPTGNCDQNGPFGPGSAPCLAGVTVKSADVAVLGLTVTGAIGEGILVTGSLAGHSIGHVVIKGNRVTGNDTGGLTPTTGSSYPSCNIHGEIPGDCGEGIHLMGVHDSVVTHNRVEGNSGGILLSDELGPTHDNEVSYNIVRRNEYDCGITVPGHNPHALDANGNRQPSVAGVYRNRISHNQIRYNGLRGEGAGVLFANATAGTAAYDNVVERNYIVGNEMAGVTLHAHEVAAGKHEDLSGNLIQHNRIGTNNLGGDPDAFDCENSCISHPLRQTTGVVVLGAVPLDVTISHNRIRNNEYGVWLGGSDVTGRLRGNLYRRVQTAVVKRS